MKKLEIVKVEHQSNVVKIYKFLNYLNKNKNKVIRNKYLEVFYFKTQEQIIFKNFWTWEKFKIKYNQKLIKNKKKKRNKNKKFKNKKKNKDKKKNKSLRLKNLLI
jgi:hypothetical protein